MPKVGASGVKNKNARWKIVMNICCQKSAGMFKPDVGKEDERI